MNYKTTIGLVLALILAVLGVWWVQSSPEADKTDQQTASGSLYDLSSGDVVGFEITDNNGNALSFAKEENRWLMTSPVSGPGERRTVNRDVRKIATLEYARTFSTDDPDRPSEEMSSLAKPRRTVKLTMADGGSHELSIGETQKLSTKTYVQKKGDETIYLVKADLNQDLRPKLADYRGKNVAKFTVGDAVRIAVTGMQTYTLVKEGTNWIVESPVKARAEQSIINSLLSAVSNMRVTRFIEGVPKSLRPYGLDTPRLSLTITTETRTLRPQEGPPASQPAEPEYDIETKVIKVAFGGTTRDSVFAKLDDPASPTVFQVPGNVLEKAAPVFNDLRAKTMTDVDTSKANRIRITSLQGAIDLGRQGDAWILSGAGQTGQTAEFAAVDELLKAVGGLTAIGFEDSETPDQGFSAASPSIEISSEGRMQPCRLVVGGRTPSKTGVYLKNEAEDAIAVVSSEQAEALAIEPFAFLSREILSFPGPQATRLDLVRSSGNCALEKQNNIWSFVSPIQAKADQMAAMNVVSDLMNLRGRRVAGLSADAARYGLNDPDVTVTVTVTPPPKPRPTTQPADAAPPPEPEPPALHTVLVSGQGGKTYAMRDGGPTICEVDGKILTDLTAELLETRVLSLVPDQAVRLAFSAEDEFAFEKAGTNWTLAGEASFNVDPAKLTEVLTALSTLKAKRFVAYTGSDPAKYGLDRPALTVTADITDGKAEGLMISSTGPGPGEHYACVAAVPDRVFVIGGEDLKKLSKQVTDFKKAG